MTQPPSASHPLRIKRRGQRATVLPYRRFPEGTVFVVPAGTPLISEAGVKFNAHSDLVGTPVSVSADGTIVFHWIAQTMAVQAEHVEKIADAGLHADVTEKTRVNGHVQYIHRCSCGAQEEPSPNRHPDLWRKRHLEDVVARAWATADLNRALFKWADSIR
jgi:hypothetical protein